MCIRDSVGIVKERLAEPDCEKGFILDGMPRTIAQGEALEQMGVDIDKVVNLIVPDEAITRRMSGRRVCAKCGTSYHIVNKPSAKEGVCDRCGGEPVSYTHLRDFRGINGNSFDGRGNYAFGLKEQIIFPEIDFDKVDAIRGMDICFVTTAKTDEEAKELSLIHI